ncbi:hypothetical protein [Marinicellulosiphila megalodicopiae]|uniref:hypothetical protein n=1 Tax=Marinicellulosiphila megalodicopiae TaxID=2724896 RepID=UPI003BAE593E
MRVIKQEYRLVGKDDTKKSFNSFRGNIKKSSADMGKMVASIGALVGAAGFGLLIKSQYETLDVTAKLSDAIGIQSEKLAGLRHAANQAAGVSDDTLDDALKEMTIRLGEAESGTGGAITALEVLGLKFEDLKNLSPDEQFYKISDAIKSVEDPTLKAHAANQLFSGSGVKLINVFNQGSDGLRKYQEEAEGLGIALNRLDLAAIESANDAMDLIKKQGIGVANVFAVALAPAITAVSTAWLENANSSSQFGSIATGAVDAVVGAVGLLADSFFGLKLIFYKVEQSLSFFAGNTLKIIGDIQAEINALSGEDDRDRKLHESEFFPGQVFSQEQLDQYATDLGVAKNQIYNFNTFLYKEYEKMYDNMREKNNTQLVADSLLSVAEEYNNKFDALVNEDRPGQKLVEQYKQVKLEIANNPISIDSPDSFDESDFLVNLDKKTNLELVSQQSKLSLMLKNITDFNKTDEEKFQESWDKKLGILDASLLNGLISQKTWSSQVEKITEQRHAAERAMNVDYYQGYASLVTGFTSQMQGQSKEWFEVHKYASIGSALINTYEATTLAYAKYGLVGGGLAFAAGMAQVSSIYNQKFGDTSAGAAPTGLAPEVDQGAPGRVFDLNNQNNTTNTNVFIQGRSIGHLIDDVRVEVGKSGQLIIPPGSAQYRNLTAKVA